ncbi:MAG: FtsQ-type POTRA domain-containing protein [Ruminococcus sp.]|nr:FtsQ-type POTRA domain-containing protein [Ruminococcus sp.]
MKDVEKTNVERNNSSKRMRRRKHKMNLYGLIVILLVLTVGIIISYTFLFNINEIRVSGESDQYTAEEIVIASGISKGDNLLRLNTSKSEQNILDNLLYVETVSIDRNFPSSLEINVTKCIPAYNVSYDMGTLLVSKKGKILADNGFITEGLPIIYGYEPSVTTPGKMIESSDKQKSEAFMEIIENLNSAEENIVSSVDMSDKYSIIVNYSNGIIFKMGNWTDIEYKLNMAWNVMNNEYVEGKTGYITMIGSNQCSFRSSDDPVYIPGVTPDTTETDTDTDSDDEDSEDDEETTTEVYDEDAEMFREYNEQNNTKSEDEDENDDSE